MSSLGEYCIVTSFENKSNNFLEYKEYFYGDNRGNLIDPPRIIVL